MCTGLYLRGFGVRQDSMIHAFQSRIPYDVFAQPGLPGIRPLPPEDWLIFDEAFADQMAERDRLVSTRRNDVIAMVPEADAPAQELLDMVLRSAYPEVDPAVPDVTVTRRDGVVVKVDRADPMGTLARLVQCDMIILQKPDGADEHVMTGAALLFPASWTLAEKFGHPLIRIHSTVDEYDSPMAKRVQRLFDGVQVGRPLWRFNALWYAEPTLHHPQREGEERALPRPGGERFMRSERQVILRLPQTRATVFVIHTFVVPETVLCPDGAPPG